MKIKKDDIKKVKDILLKIPYTLSAGNYIVFFPIDQTEDKVFDGLSLTVSDGKADTRVTPGIALISNMNPQFGYANLTYSLPFNILQYCELLNIKVSKKDLEILKSIECYIIQKEYLYMAFDNN